MDGNGLYATAPIQKGQVIFYDTPIWHTRRRIEDQEFPTVTWKATNDIVCEALCDPQIQTITRLLEIMKKMGVSDVPIDGEDFRCAAKIKQKCDTSDAASSLSADELNLFVFSVYNRFTTNQVEYDGMYSSGKLFHATILFENISKINHSCKPNSSFVPMKHDVYAIVAKNNIKEGDEIVRCYDHAVYGMQRDKRSVYLKNKFMFSCGCIECAH